MTYPRKVEIWPGRAWGGTDGAKRWQITRRGWGEGGGVAGRRGMGTKTTYPRKVAIWVGGPGVAQGVPRGSKSRGGARGESP